MTKLCVQSRFFLALFINASMFFLHNTAATASDFVEASEALCEKIRQCTYKEMKQQADLAPEMRAAVEQMMDKLCENMEASYREAANKNGFEKPAARCVRSIAKLSCDEITTSKETKECKAFQELANTSASK